MTQLANFTFGAIEQESQATIGKTPALELPYGVVIKIGKRLLLERQFDIDNFLDLRQEPWVDTGQAMDFFKTEALREGVAHVPDALGARFAKLYLKLLAISGFLVEAVGLG